ncbi:hypothetical protein BT93_D2085 [Corymbia citriodora subsp. variegata]|nr:hypothetical protein BT93_D2085 [Corymbia citriodora subsp. variegata]
MTLFLTSRSKELVRGGHMVLTMIGRYTSINLPDDQVSSVLELLGMTGLIEEEKLDNCNMPCYLATPEEVRHVIQEEGSFHITRFETFNVSWDAEMGDGDLRARGKYVAASMRAITEPILAVHFGEEVMDDLFERFARKVSQYVELHDGEYFNILVSVKNR